MDDQEFKNVMDAFEELNAVYAEVDAYRPGDELAGVSRSFEEGTENERQKEAERNKNPDEETDV
jgi:hypothetical protein